jgi:hypothetical protein
VLGVMAGSKLSAEFERNGLLAFSDEGSKLGAVRRGLLAVSTVDSGGGGFREGLLVPKDSYGGGRGKATGF